MTTKKSSGKRPRGKSSTVKSDTVESKNPISPELAKEEIRKAAEDDLLTFIRLVAPYRMIASFQEDLCSWWERDLAKDHQMALIPRDHGKSWLVALRVCHRIVKFPDIRILYISSTSNLAEKQLKLIKDVLTSPIFTFYWPEYVNAEEGKREKWTTSEISIDHPKRAAEGVRDPTVFTGGLTTSLTGLHCDIAVLDDVVVKENAYTTEGRNKVAEQYSLLASIEGASAKEWVVGTRYHPKDLYSTLRDMVEDIYGTDGEVIAREPVYEVFECAVEDKGDGTGNFLWPKKMRSDGKWFGFDQQILARKRAQYLDKMQFRAQYYNDPNDPTEARIKRDKFQYFERKFLRQEGGSWFFKDRRLNVYASIDFAFSTKSRADFTSIVVVGVDYSGNIYVMDIERIKTNKISDYYKAILDLHVKYDFRKLRAEVSVAQEVIVKDLKDNYIKPNGLALSILEHRPVRSMGSKEERMAAILEPRYDNLSIWHYRGGNCELLEEELLLDNPPHDDIKDALASAIEIAIPPTGMRNRGTTRNVITFNSRFGGVSHT